MTLRSAAQAWANGVPWAEALKISKRAEAAVNGKGKGKGKTKK